MSPADDTPRITRLLMAGAVIGVCLLVPVAVIWSAQLAVLGMGAMAALAAVARTVSPKSWALGSRGRGTDIAVLSVLAGALIFLGATTPLS